MAIERSALNKHLLKIIAFVLSILLWLYVVSAEPIEIEKQVAIQYILPDKRVFASDAVKETKIKLKGPRAFLRSVLKNDLKILINLAKLKASKGDNYLVNLSGKISPPFGTVITAIHPKEVAIKLDRSMKKTLPIKIQTLGDPFPTYKVFSQKITPARIEVIGPRRLIKKLSSISTMPIEIGKLRGQGELNVELDFSNENISQLSFQPVVFAYNIRPTQANMQIKLLKIRFLSSKKIVKRNHLTVDIDVLSEKGAEAKIDKSKIQIVADVPDDAAQGWVKVKLQASLPQGFYLLKINPEEVTVLVR